PLAARIVLERRYDLPLAARTRVNSSAYFEVELVVTGCFSRSTDSIVQGPVERETLLATVQNCRLCASHHCCNRLCCNIHRVGSPRTRGQPVHIEFSPRICSRRKRNLPRPHRQVQSYHD